MEKSKEVKIEKSQLINIPKHPRPLTEGEKAKGRSQGYYQLSAEEQWNEDKRLGILDWDGD